MANGKLKREKIVGSGEKMDVLHGPPSFREKADDQARFHPCTIRYLILSR